MGSARGGDGYLESKRQSDQANRFRSERFADGSSKEGLHLMNYSNVAAPACPASRTLAAIANTVTKNFAPVGRFGQIGVLTAAFALAAGSVLAQQPIAPAPAPAAKPAAPAPAKKPA